MITKEDLDNLEAEASTCTHVWTSYGTYSDVYVEFDVIINRASIRVCKRCRQVQLKGTLS